MPGGVLATSGEVGKASEEACGVLTVSNKIAPAAPKRRARGGKASRARRLENFRQHKAAAPAAAPAIKWEQLAHGLLRQQRATLRDGARAAWVRMRAARAKIGAAVRSAWRCRSLEITGIYIERDGVRQYVTGEKVAPLSRRDVYILSRAADRVWWSWNYFGFNEFDPESDRFYRHVRDWLRMETDDGAPHWVLAPRRASRAGQRVLVRRGRVHVRPGRPRARVRIRRRRWLRPHSKRRPRCAHALL